jgi:TorA maturation chaperone TorD
LGYDNIEYKAELSHKEYRRDSYKILSECYYLPDKGLLDNLSSLDTKKGRVFSNLAKHRPGISDIDSLTVDYSKLFVGPYELLAPPYGSVYLEDKSRVMGNSTVDVKKRYAEEGLDIGLKEAPDHIAIELEFMYFLIFMEVEAIRISDSGTAASYQEKQRAFLETHLGMWVSEFADNVETNAQTTFYKSLARITKSFIRRELENLPLNSISAKNRHRRDYVKGLSSSQ